MSHYENHSLPVRAAGAGRAVASEIPGAARCFIRMPWMLKVAWAWMFGVYELMGALIEASEGEHIAWAVVCAVAWTVIIAWFAACIDKDQ